MDKENSIICPYCQADLAKKPSRKTKCPSCSNMIYVKRAPNEDVKRLVTELEANNIEELWSRKGRIDKYKQWLHGCGINGSLFDGKIEEIRSGMGEEWAEWNTVYALVQQGLKDVTNHHNRKMLYHVMALLLGERGLNAYEAQKSSFREELLGYKQTGSVRTVRVLSEQRRTCHICSAYQGKEYRLDEALDIMPLPPVKCSCGIGTIRANMTYCYYVPV